MSGRAGIIAPSGSTEMEAAAATIVDDLLYNVIHDLVLKAHRSEKMARARTAALSAEKLATTTANAGAAERPAVRVETPAAVYDHGAVTLKGNPLRLVTEHICPRCHLPRLLYPTDGVGARPPDPSVTYCKRAPVIEKANHDIYGQTWIPMGPGRGKKKKDMAMEIPATAAERPPNVLSYPSATCSNCKRCILVTRLNNHMGSCIGNSGRSASRVAAQKMASSQEGTPAAPSRRGTPPVRKREGDALPIEDEEPRKKIRVGGPKIKVKREDKKRKSPVKKGVAATTA